ncbi:hypothetical protein [Mycobacterium ostraviense]|uniref:hypothetical protein n=1 Tax=Mycobacterium ostraviense TaxID=2738409 RepID=UPI000B06AF0B|nr:hypothetical protein [Mycobacterium ostraviense]UGT90462.1 hypothetical protein LTS72_19385 [Mycobacterium ostraviense]
MLSGWHLALALTSRARVAMAQGEPEQAERDAHDALTVAVETCAHNCIPDILDCLAAMAVGHDSHREAAPLYGAAESMRQRLGAKRFKSYDSSHADSVALLRTALGSKEFDSAWAEGTALSSDEAIAYAQRGRGERRRAATGWESVDAG